MSILICNPNVQEFCYEVIFLLWQTKNLAYYKTTNFEVYGLRIWRITYKMFQPRASCVLDKTCTTEP